MKHVSLAIQKVLRDRRTLQLEARIVTKSGEIKVVEATMKPEIVHGNIDHIFGIVRDITDRKQSEVEKIKLAQSENPDLIILDLYMPVRNGLSILSQVRAGEGCKDTPVMILTSDDQTKSKELAYEMGVSSYLTKPINSDKVKQEVASLISQTNGIEGMGHE